MRFTQPDTSVFYEVGNDASISVNEVRFRQIVVEEAEAVWSDYNLASVQNRVEEFEAEYGEMDASGLYQLNKEDDDLKVVAHKLKQYPLDPAMTNEEEPGSMPSGDYDDLNEHLIDAQKEVAERVTERLDEFVTVAA